jgi:putative ABC transport system permease protein
MFRNYFAAALRNLARNRFYSAISITGLSMGLCALLLTGLVIRNQMSYDHFIPGYERTYLAASALIPTDRVPYYDTHTPSWIAPLLKLKFHEIEAIARLADQDLRLRKGNIEATEKIYWADPNAFDVLPLWGPSATLTAASGDLRTALQFAALVGLLIAAAVVYRQRVYATQEALRVNVDQMLIIRSPCTSAFETELRRLPGVRGAVCSSLALITGASFGNYRLKDGSVLAIGDVPVDFGIFDLYGLKPVAGQFPPTRDDAALSSGGIARYVINETAARRFGFASASAAIGQPLPLAASAENGMTLKAAGYDIVAVVPDFSINSVEHKITPSLYYSNSKAYNIISVKLTGRGIPEALRSIDRLWATIDGTTPVDRFFLDEYIQSLYLDMLREAQLFGAFSCVAVLLACLGLVGLSASATERRTKEIGIRKVMGARTIDIVRLLVWQFIRPVLWANVIAWPVAAFLMSRWLRGFAYHVDLELWPFLAASSLALLSALLTVGAQSYLVARNKPVAALRYE